MMAPDAALVGDRVLVDSSLWIEYYQSSGRAEVQAAMQDVLTGDQVGTMAMVVVEVLRGALTEAGYETLDKDLRTLHWLEVTPRVAQLGARLGFDLERDGKRVPATDLLIAATAIEHGYTLWHNDAHFDAVAAVGALAHRRFGR